MNVGTSCLNPESLSLCPTALPLRNTVADGFLIILFGDYSSVCSLECIKRL